MKRVENRVDDLEEKLAAVQAELQRLDIEQMQSGIKKIPLLEESISTLIKKIDNLSHEVTRPSTTALEGLQQHLTTSGSGKEKGTLLDIILPTPGSALDSLPRRLELPVFEGLNPEGWLFRDERHFELNNLSPAEKLRSAVVCFEGDALSWYYYEEGRRPFRSWDELKIQLLERFQLTQEGALHDQLFSLQQTTTVREYRRQFEVLSAPLSDLSESILEIVFRKGHQPDIRAELRLMDPMGLPKRMRMAQQIEDKNIAMQLYQRNSPFHLGLIFQEMWLDNFLQCLPLPLQVSPMRRQLLHPNFGVCQKPKCRKKEKRACAFVVM